MLNNCKRCGKLYLHNHGAYCEDCRKEEAELYRTVREYIAKNPRSTLLDVHTHTQIPIPKLLQMQKDSFLQFKNP
ncbi:hypothetical protein [Paenibacillus hexagrammi]|uniref:Flagellar protein n=1 Tax=Paenibacillus hexagrammi TaxID=2908839 RepID=A0ABY3SEB0_9BACL|nr:hypothetical protein [Paenibacillus sp. YPD9-1]UJF32324.1 hypothetical protein L0M14_21820 [Paenibacillus sp. YPD9-1]